MMDSEGEDNILAMLDVSKPFMSDQLKQKIWRYWLCMNASAFDAAVHSSVFFSAVGLGHAASASVPALDLKT